MTFITAMAPTRETGTARLAMIVAAAFFRNR